MLLADSVTRRSWPIQPHLRTRRHQGRQIQRDVAQGRRVLPIPARNGAHPELAQRLRHTDR